MLGHYVCELNLFSLEEAVRKMTSLSARVYNFERKGVLRSRMDADLVVFDLLNVESPATFEDPNCDPTGIYHDGQRRVRGSELRTHEHDPRVVTR